MQLSIYSIQNTLFEGEVEKIIARTPMGEITALNNHLPLVATVLGPTLEVFDKAGKKNIINFASGFLEIKPGGEVTVLAEEKL